MTHSSRPVPKIDRLLDALQNYSAVNCLGLVIFFVIFQELNISDSISGLTFSILTCTDAVENVAQNHSECLQKKSCLNFLGGVFSTGGHTVT